jgi:DNA-binding transcriptional regulator LsrR (DeoR family)
MVENTKQKIDRRLVQTCRLFYEERLTKSEIARRQQLSVTHVNRLLIEGQRLGFVEIRVLGPRLKSLEIELLRRYDLKDVRVVASADDPGSTLIELGKQGAAVFDETVRTGSRVGVSSGRTMFEVVSRIPEESREISIYPLNVIHESETRVTGVSANTSATILWFRSRPSAIAHRIELFFPENVGRQPRELVQMMQQDPSIREALKALDDLDVFLLGAGDAGIESRFATLQNRPLADIESEGHLQSVGDIAFNALNETGEQLQTGAEELIFHVNLQTLKSSAKSPRKSVILVAGGMNKSRVIEAAIQARLCNILVTDSDVAEHLLKNRDQKNSRLQI